jgi:hypothetical protein
MIYVYAYIYRYMYTRESEKTNITYREKTMYHVPEYKRKDSIDVLLSQGVMPDCYGTQKRESNMYSNIYSQ